MVGRRCVLILLALFAATRLDVFSIPRAAADSSSPTAVLYGVSGSGSPRVRTWNGSSWSSASSLSALNDEPYWIIAVDCPKRNEIACVFLDQSKDVRVNFLSSGSWTGNTTLCTNTGTEVHRPVDAAYEQSSGDFLVVYYDDGESNLGYYTYNGSTLSGEFDLARPAGAKAHYLQLCPRPASNELMLLYHADSGALYANVWSGSGWTGWTTVTSGTSTSSSECFSVAFEHSSTHALVTYAENHTQPRYRTWNGTSWSSESSMPATGSSAPTFVRLAADPQSDRIVFASLDGNKQISANVWSGTGWGSNLVAENDGIFNDTRFFDVAFEAEGGQALLVYGQDGIDRYRYRTLTGTTWSSEQTGSDINAIPRSISLTPASSGEGIFVQSTDSSSDFNVAYWNGSSMSSASQLVGSISGVQSTRPFAIATSGVPRFVNVTTAMGFNVTTSNSLEWGSGLHFGDLDNDGDLDVLMTGNSSSRIGMNNGSSFSMSTFGGGSIYRQAALADVENDGDLDIWCMPHYDTERLYLNDGSGSFSNFGNAGFSNPSNSEGIAAADVNRDGWCDVIYFAENANWIGHNDQQTPPAYVGANSSSYGMNDITDYGNGDYCSSGDVNNDGYLDFFYNYNGGKLFLSDGDGTFTENRGNILVETGEADKMGSAWGDFDNDGDLDLFVSREDSTGTRPYLWRNDNGAFTNVAAARGLTTQGYMRGCTWGDYDNDGDLDLFIVKWSNQATVLYQNQGAPNYDFVAVDEGVTISGSTFQDASFVDYDNDGDLDLAMTRESATALLYRNNTDDTNYLKVRVVGRGSGATNRAGVGVRVELWSADGSTFLQRRDLGLARGYGGTTPLWEHFGGVNASSTYTLKVYFHSRSMASPYTVSVVPAAVSTTIGATMIPQMITVDEPLGRKRVQTWSEVAIQSP